MEQARVEPAVVGQFHTFGEAGVAYEVVEELDDHTVKIRVVETGETLDYDRDQLAADPLA
ncbi:DUF5397 family protein [Tateyamaria sp. ANG-S1]|uniref:DUF5397 family protein n=1 Tax=Tateyamaria sp. ANG-S1 TaxID=1577905 RepID=UPI00057E4455|nr:DUF5397 family protein [Tateyamaria sp. ANG-S1]KIC45452.1 hypothetical protein RA29_20645 [Tateyamaria sp. ANG-S1]